MAAIDFPNSPTLNQEFTANGRTWIWNGTVWANKTSNTSVSRYNVSDTAPSSPASGDVWFNSTNARTYVYYDSFWVESNPALDGKSGVSAVASPITNSGTQSAAVLGLDYSALQYGQNAVINGAMDFWQRGTSFSAVGYTADRWRVDFGGTGASAAVTQQTFTPGTAPVSDREATYYTQVVTTPGSDAGSYITFEQRIEDVRTFEGKTVTISLWAKAASGTPRLGLEVIQNGVGANVLGIGSQSVTLSTSWARYSFTYNIPALSMTFAQAGAQNLSLLSLNFWLSNGSTLNARSGSVGLQAATFHLWGVQAEVGSTATPFKRAAGTIQGELAACQRYYQTSYPIGVALQGLTNLTDGGTWVCINTSDTANGGALPVTMRGTPVFAVYSSNGSVAANSARDGGGSNITGINLIGGTSNSLPRINKNGGLPTTGNPLTAHWTANAEL